MDTKFKRNLENLVLKFSFPDWCLRCFGYMDKKMINALMKKGKIDSIQDFFFFFLRNIWCISKHDMSFKIILSYCCCYCLFYFF